MERKAPKKDIHFPVYEDPLTVGSGAESLKKDMAADLRLCCRCESAQ